MQNQLRKSVFVAMLAYGTCDSCWSQSVKDAEENIPKEVRSRADVEVIVEKLRILQLNESLLGENHLNKKSIQTEIREYEFDLKTIVELHKSLQAKANIDGNTYLENALPSEFAAREEVQPIIRKLKYLRMNSKYLGENHPSKKSTEEQIRRHEFALNKMLGDTNSSSPKSSDADRIESNQPVAPQDLENPREVRVLVQKLEVLKKNQANYGENHPNWRIIQAEIREHESKLGEFSPLAP